VNKINSMRLIDQDPYLQPYLGILQSRLKRFESRLGEINTHFSDLISFASWHKDLGFHLKSGQLVYRDWIPQVKQVALVGDFNLWDKNSHPLKKENNDLWSIKIPVDTFPSQTPHQQKIKLRIQTEKGEWIDRIPAMVNYCFQDPTSKEFYGLLWFPEKKHVWKSNAPKAPQPLLVYEAHIGMAQEKQGLGTYLEFRDEIIPRIAKGNYNAIQLMGIQEHPYYGSFGYQVSSYFAPSSRFGTPEDLKSLIDTAHSYGLIVILDLVHSHSVKNTLDGLGEYNGTDYQYFHSGPKGIHSLWDSRLFNYGKHEVQRFLLSNIVYWLEEFHFDGFRFDGVTSMLFEHHGHYKQFNHYDMYFGKDVEEDSILYLQLANTVMHQVKKEVISIAEDISGMPGLCRPIDEGGIGFDYRMHMGVADFWIKIIKEYKDENWPLNELYHELTTGRFGEKKICYAESHDQAMVGDKTLAFQLMDKEMYSNMSKNNPSLIIDRGISLLKLIRYLTISLGGDGYLNFMGNEFAHPEWIDFPREGNNNSYHYARRQWSLCDNQNLKYSYLLNFDRDMLKVTVQNKEANAMRPTLLNLDTVNSVLIFCKGDLVWFFNFHPTKSIEGYQFGVQTKGKYKVEFETDDLQYGGFNRIEKECLYETTEENSHGRAFSLKIYTPSRTAILLKRQ